MKKFFSLLLSAGMLFGFTACGGDDNEKTDNGGGGGGTDFTAKITATVDGNSVDVAVEPGKGFEATPYKIWVVKKADYTETVPADAVEATGKKTETFSDLAYDEYYYAVASDGTKFRTKEFLTDEPGAVDPVTPPSLKGSDYYVISLDEESYAKIEGKVTSDLRTDDLTMYIDWWNGAAFTPGSCVGPNSYGLVYDWMALNINQGSGWFAVAYRLISPLVTDIAPANPETGKAPDGKVTQEQYDAAVARRAHLADINENFEDYVLHFAMKSDGGYKYQLTLFGSGDDGALPCQIGDENDTYGFKRDGSWTEIEIPMSFFKVSPKFDINSVNILALTQASDAPFPKDINLDAVFIYKPAK